jgi:hypothetical protein
VTTYGQLLDIATQDLATATVRARHPSTRPTPGTGAGIAGVADALAHLGTTLGPNHLTHRSLRARLHALARVRVPTPPADYRPRGVELDLVDAAVALRTAADLIASTGPLPEAFTDHLLHHSTWTRPRPEPLHSDHARAAGWAQIADLALMAADLPPAALPDLGRAAEAVAHAALRVPRPASTHLPLQQATPGWPLPLPRHPVPNEWDGRLAELSALAWRLTRPPMGADPHPAAALRAIAEIGYHLHRRAAEHPDTHGPLQQPLRDRAELWNRIHACVAALHTPTTPLTGEQRWSLLRTRELAAVGDLDVTDLFTGQTTLALAAAYGPAALEHLTERPSVQLGPAIPRELRTSRQARFAALHRAAIPLPQADADALAHLYRTAAAPTAEVDVHPALALATPALVPSTRSGPRQR